MAFDPTKQFGNFVEIVPPGEKSMHNASIACLGGVPWNLLSITFAIGLCMMDYDKFVPEKYHSQIRIIRKEPGDAVDPLVRVGCVAWKYEPLQKGSG